MSKTIPILTLAIGLGVGAWCDHQWAGPTAAVGEVAASAATSVTTPFAGRQDAVALPATPDLSVLRATIREELVSVLAAKGGAGAVVAASRPAAPAPELVAQRHDAETQITAMVAGGTWGNEQRISFRQKLSVLDAGQRERAMQQLISGINSGAVRVDDEGPPL